MLLAALAALGFDRGLLLSVPTTAIRFWRFNLVVLVAFSYIHFTRASSKDKTIKSFYGFDLYSRRSAAARRDRLAKVTTKSIRLEKFGPGCAVARGSTAVLEPRRQLRTPP